MTTPVLRSAIPQPSQPADPLPPAMPPVPRIAVSAFCETAETTESIVAAARDRHMLRAQVAIHHGGIAAAEATLGSAHSPNVIIVETQAGRAETLQALDGLAHVCDPGTKVIVVGHVNDIQLYRELITRGVSEYLITPVAPLDLIRTITDIYNRPDSQSFGRIVAVVGAKGGAGASTIAHNLAASVARELGLAAVIADLDVAFGTASLNLNLDPPQGVADALAAPDRLDNNFIDRLMVKCADNLNLLAAPAVLDRTWDLDQAVIDKLLGTLRSAHPVVVLDLPHLWTSWARHALVDADMIVIVAAPDLASLRNTKNMVDMLRQARPSDRQPYLVLNQLGLPKRPEISVQDFAKAVGLTPTATIAFDAQLFGNAANNGQMLHHVQPNGRAAQTLNELATTIMGRTKKSADETKFLQALLAKLAALKRGGH
ncbi:MULTISPECIES: AAA family ATPase [unclassified Chelatococcus]|uniref:AAA family ATPase n=1 Tax=unclassified Chelatococcus TaxID=2638111 RepID=UPI0020BDB239|nr:MULTISPECIES: AAA family ATPase [unclassified Chelatococcus]MCO5077175.1 AAA family ATPase [Chelatococcus sp.]CAH1662081.1 Type II/IV secretion system ATPase TadZ/CpaE, associated with Flp pilus assembly [Hyphomicrobiales bacterium]CAH1682847.1 Type II/IV secretion system ATPase TadZ/CpaE, associated with Flp pilus assembly [Hyphomicrobiales bacterium]